MQPLEVSDWELQLGPKHPERYIPMGVDIPQEFVSKRHNDFLELAMHWFFHGLPKETVFTPKLQYTITSSVNCEGCDPTAVYTDHALAVRHITAALRSTTVPKKELFMGVGYLLSQWYETIDIPGVRTYGH